MASSRPFLLTVCKGLALLAALMLALIPALPAQAHMHVPTLSVSGSHIHSHTTTAADAHQQGSLPDEAPDAACDCCIAGHLPVMPLPSAVPVPTCAARAPVKLANARIFDDALSERLPDPPKHSV